jgi:hypothetical protein
VTLSAENLKGGNLNLQPYFQDPNFGWVSSLPQAKGVPNGLRQRGGKDPREPAVSRRRQHGVRGESIIPVLKAFRTVGKLHEVGNLKRVGSLLGDKPGSRQGKTL